MRLSFVKDSEANINEFMAGILQKPKSAEEKKLKEIKAEVMEIGNPSLLLESMLQNMLYNKQLYHNFTSVLEAYDQLVFSDFLLKNSFRYRNELDVFHFVKIALYRCLMLTTT